MSPQQFGVPEMPRDRSYRGDPRCYLDGDDGYKKHTMTNQEINKRFAELVGIKWLSLRWENGFNYDDNPNFISDPRLVLREMDRIGKLRGLTSHACPIMNLTGITEWLRKYILDNTTGLMVRMAIAWLEKEQKGKEKP